MDYLARRYNLNPVELIAPGIENPFLHLAYLRIIAETGAKFEADQMEKAEKEAERKAKINRR